MFSAKPTILGYGQVLVLAFLIGGCGAGAEIEDLPIEKEKEELSQPSVTMVAPTAIAAGDVVSIYGADFVDPSAGQVRLVFSGSFLGTDGQSQNVTLEVVPRYKSRGIVEWDFGPNLPLSPSDQTGVFRGKVEAVNIGYNGERKTALSYPVIFDLRPSILIRQFRPVQVACPVGLTGTTENTNMLIDLETVGLRAGKDGAPLRYTYTFMREQFNFRGYLGDQLGMNPESLFPATGPVTIVDDVYSGTRSHLGSGVPTQVNVHQGSINDSNLLSSIDNQFNLTTLTTSAITNDVANYFQASIIVTATDSSGMVIRRTIPLRVWSGVEIDYKGGFKEVESFDAVPVTGCIPGDDLGREVVYSESSSETRTRSYSVNSSVGASLDIKIAKVNASFGVDVSGSVSSSESKDLKLVGFILPNEFGVFYRQTTQIERIATLRSHGPCGSTNTLGEIVVTDWVWAPDLGKGKTCNPMPETNFPPGQVY